MEIYQEILQSIEKPENRNRLEEVLNWVSSTFPTLKPEIKWNQPLDYELLEKIINFNITDKADCTTYWRKNN